MKTQLTRLLLAAPLALFTVAGCDDDGGGSSADAAVDGSQMFDGGVDGPAAETGTGGTGGDSGGTDGGGGDTTPVNPACAPADPNVYPAAMFAANTTAEKTLVDNIKKLNDAMTTAEATLTATITRAAIDTDFASIKPAVSAYYAGQLEGPGAIFDQFVDATNNKTFAPGTSPGLYGTWAFNANGVDLRQQFDKGLMSALQYKHMAEISRLAAVTPADVDRMLAIMGGDPAFVYNTTDDKSVAKYASRRSNRSDMNNLYLTIKRNSILARAAAANPQQCATELSAALKQIRESWEKALITTTLFYAADARTKLGAATSDTTKAAALHAIGEGIAFTHGFKSLPAQDRILTDADADEILRNLGYLETAAAVTATTLTPYKFVLEFPSLAKLDAVVTKIQNVYGLTAAQVASLKTNHM